MQKMQFNITTLSTLIVSPRSSHSFYMDSDKDAKKFKVIYPFFQYGEYENYAPQNAAYYLPGSSIKGALCMGIAEADKKQPPLSLLIDDIPIQNEWIVLNQLYKAQYVDEPSQTRFAVFFDNVHVEMLKANVQLTGELYTHEKRTVEELFRRANETTRCRMLQMLAYLQKLQSIGGKEEFLIKIKQIVENLTPLKDCNDVLLLGGYKGLLHSLQLQYDLTEINKGKGIYVDEDTTLPHGLIKFELI